MHSHVAAKCRYQRQLHHMQPPDKVFLHRLLNAKEEKKKNKKKFAERNMVPPILQKAYCNGFELSHSMFPADLNGNTLALVLSNNICKIIQGSDDWERTGRSIWCDSVEIKIEILRSTLVPRNIGFNQASSIMHIYLICDTQNNGITQNYSATDIWQTPNIGSGSADDLTASQNPSNEERFRILHTFKHKCSWDVVWDITSGFTDANEATGQWYLETRVPLGLRVDYNATTSEPATNNLFLYIKFGMPDTQNTSTSPGSASEITGTTTLRFYDNPFTETSSNMF